MSVKAKNNAEQQKEISTPGSNPSSENQFVYPKSDKQQYCKTSDGREFRIEGNGSKIMLSQTQL